MVEIKLPDISENVDSGDVTKVLVSEGDKVEKDQPLIELETDKAVFEVPATSAGVVKEISVAVGDTVKVGSVIVRLDESGADDEADGADTGGEEKKEETSQPEGGEEDEQEQKEDEGRDETGEDEGDEEKKNEREEAPAKAAKTDARGGRGSEVPKEEDEEQPEPAVDEPEKRGGERESRRASVVPLPRTGPAPASPTVRRLAREVGVDINEVPGTGPGGRISADDVHRFAREIIQAASRPGVAPERGAPASKALPDFSSYGEVERVAMSKIRRVTAANLANAWTTVPAVTQNDEADVTDLEAARRKYAKLADDAGGKLTMTAILLKLCAGALRRFPDVNASIDVAAGEIVYKKYVHIGVAVDTEHGLLVPVIRDVDDKSIIELSVELADVAARARERKLKPAEMEGANFTVSNLGGIGGTTFSPIVNTPESAILGVSRAKMQPVWDGEAFEPRLMMPLSLSYDHRFVDGALAARFVRWLAEALENPILLALGA
jgi:pyruvate dehydrogenase E2 component (dihydrolipoamide acetyltransferase)